MSGLDDNTRNLGRFECFGINRQQDPDLDRIKTGMLDDEGARVVSASFRELK